MVASKEKSFDILDRYFTETPDEEIREYMRKKMHLNGLILSYQTGDKI